MNQIIAALQGAFFANEGAFLLQLRCDLIWSKQAFERLIQSMQAHLESERDKENIERWVAEGFWYLSHFVKDWTSHEDFPKPFASNYYESAYERLYDLSYRLFFGEPPYESGSLDPFNA